VQKQTKEFNDKENVTDHSRRRRKGILNDYSTTLTESSNISMSLTSFSRTKFDTLTLFNVSQSFLYIRTLRSEERNNNALNFTSALTLSKSKCTM